jgi:hypothetical protein
MRRYLRILWFSTLLVASCGGASKWQIACGCATVSNRAAWDLGINTFLDDGSIDADLLVAKLKENLSRRTAIETFDAVRELGQFHDKACYLVNLKLVRCHYWMWEAASERRGIQVDITGDVAAVPQDLTITYRYVEEPI